MRVRVRARVRVGVRVRVRVRDSFCTRKPRSCAAAAFMYDLAGPEIVSAGPEMPRHRLELTSKRRTWLALGVGLEAALGLGLEIGLGAAL